MSVNCTPARDGKKAFGKWLEALGGSGHRSVFHGLRRIWITTTATAASVDGTGLDADMKVGDLVVYVTGTTPTAFVCTVVPSSDAGTFIKLSA